MNFYAFIGLGLVVLGCFFAGGGVLIAISEYLCRRFARRSLSSNEEMIIYSCFIAFFGAMFYLIFGRAA